MKKILTYVLVVLVAIVAIILGMAMQQPKEMHIERSVTTSASGSAVYAIMSDLHRFQEWSPFQKLDPSAQPTFNEIPMGPGSSLSWDGNAKMGAGRMTVMSLTPESRVDIKLEFLRPFESTSTTAWTVTDEGAQRRITWSMDCNNVDLMPRVMHVFLNMDKLAGKDFEDGLQSLKAIAEKESI